MARCGNCGGRTARPPQTQNSAAVLPAGDPEELIEVVYRGGAAQVEIVVDRQSYGFHSGGDRLMVKRRHAELQPSRFVPVERLRSAPRARGRAVAIRSR